MPCRVRICRLYPVQSSALQLAWVHMYTDVHSLSQSNSACGVRRDRCVRAPDSARPTVGCERHIGPRICRPPHVCPLVQEGGVTSPAWPGRTAAAALVRGHC